MPVGAANVRNDPLLRPARPTDLSELLAIQSLCREATPWSEEDYRRLLRGDGTLRCTVVESRDRLTGFTVYQPLGTDTEIANLAVHPDHRR